MAKSAVVKRSVVMKGHKTSISLENEFWQGFKIIAKLREMSVSDLAAHVDDMRTANNLSSQIRLFVLQEAMKGTFEASVLPQDVSSGGLHAVA